MGQGRHPVNGRISLGLAASAVAMLLIPAAAEARKAPLDAQIIAPPQVKGKKLQASVLLSQRTAKKLKLRSPVATFVSNSGKKLRAPNPMGPGRVEIAARTLRAGDTLRGRAKLKGKRDKLVPKVKGMKFKVKSRESAFSVDELTAVIFSLSKQLNALTLRVDELEKSLAVSITNLEGDLAALQAAVTTLQSELNTVKSDLAVLTSTVDGLGTEVDAINAELDALEAKVLELETTLALLCGDSLVC